MSEGELIARVEEMFRSKNFDLNLLENRFPEFAPYFHSPEIKTGTIKEHSNGVKSVQLLGTGNGIPSTFGLLPRGDFKFNTEDNVETMHYLLGGLGWGKTPEEKIVQANRATQKKLIISARQDLILRVTSPTLYLCDYLQVLNRPPSFNEEVEDSYDPRG